MAKKSVKSLCVQLGCSETKGVKECVECNLSFCPEHFEKGSCPESYDHRHAEREEVNQMP